MANMGEGPNGDTRTANGSPAASKVFTPLRYAVVTSRRVGYASRFVEQIAERPAQGADLVAVVFCHASTNAVRSRGSRLKRRLRKAAQIGVFGSINGVRMRKWFGDDVNVRLRARDILALCRQLDVPLTEIPGFADPDGQQALRAMNLDLAISMGNAYIPRSFFGIPRLGMINVHHELLPEYKGAQTALWQIHNGSRISGFTIHQIDERIDAGRILVREEIPLVFRASLRETIIENVGRIQLRSIDGLVRLLGDFNSYLRAARDNTGGASYTTPSTRAMLRILLNHRRLRDRGVSQERL